MRVNQIAQEGWKERCEGRRAAIHGWLAGPPSPQGGWVGKLGGSPAESIRMAGEPAYTKVCANAGQASTFAFQRRQQTRRDPSIFNPLA